MGLPSSSLQVATGDICPRGLGLVIARVGWVLVVACTLATIVGSLPSYYTRLQNPVLVLPPASLMAH